LYFSIWTFFSSWIRIRDLEGVMFGKFV
jgi:hypothetical protein